MNMPHLPVKSLRLKKVQTENLILGIHFLLLKSVKFSMKNHRNVLYWQKHEDKGQET